MIENVLLGKENRIFDFGNVSLYLRGKINQQTYSSLRKMKPTNKLMIFVSSTFIDTIQERDILHEKILPVLQNKAMQEDIQVLLYDMRFGVKDENTLDHLTWISCREAIEQCFEESDGLFFLSLQGDRYGYMPLPKHLGKTTFENALKQCVEDAHNNEKESLAIHWYRLDENSIQMQYELRGLRSLNQKTFWEIILPALRDHVFENLPFQSLSTGELLVGRSVTEWETLFALSLERENCFWIHRLFEQSSLRSGMEISPIEAANLCDGLNDYSVLQKHQALLHNMEKILLPSQICRFSNISAGDYLQKKTNYLNDWEVAIQNKLNTELEMVSSKKSSWSNRILFEFGLPVNYFEEMLHHNNIARVKSLHFMGREGLVKKAMDLLQIKSQHCVKFGGLVKCVLPLFTHQKLLSHPLNIALYVVGVSGAGKTAFMSKLVMEIQDVNDIANIPVIVRFCGTSSYSLYGKDLVQSISIQILCIYERKDKLQELIGIIGKQSYQEAVDYFGSLMIEFPVYLFIDSLDQLSNRDEARQKLSFLRNIKLHKKSRIIVSTLPDEKDEKTGEWKYLFLCEKRLKENRVPRIEIGMIDTKETTEIRSILEELLKRQGKKLSLDQWQVVLNAAMIEPTMLYLNLSIELISQWRSFDKDVMLQATVKGLIHQICDDLERQYGKHFTSFALGFITYSRDGINDIEMKDCLSLQKNVLEEVFQYSTLQSFPIHVWLRLKGALKNVIAEKENHCIKWYHRQLWETTTERYFSIKRECHQIMGRYFGNLLDTAEVKEKGIHNQELSLNNVNVWLPNCKINSRRVREGYYHLVEADMLKEAANEMCSLDFVCASAIIRDGYNLLSYLGRLCNNPILKSIADIDNKRIDDYFLWLRRGMSAIMTNFRSQLTNTAENEPMRSTVYKEYIKKRRMFKTTDVGAGGIVWVTTISRKRELNSLLVNWQDNDGVLSVAWNYDGSKIVSGSQDGTVKIWDTATGEVLNTFEGHNNKVNSVAWNYNGTKVASGSWDKTIIIWDAFTGELTRELISTLKGQNLVNSVSWNFEGTKIASGSYDCTIKIWDTATGKVLRTWKGHTRSVNSVAWHPDGKKIASGSDDNTVMVWDAVTGKAIFTFAGHTNDVETVAWNHDGTLIASASQDKTVRIWDLTSRNLITILKGHRDPFKSLAWNYDGTKLAAGSLETIVIWDITTGQQITTFKGHSADIDSLSWNHNGTKLVSASSHDRAIKIWDTANGEERNTINEYHDCSLTAGDHISSNIPVESIDARSKISDEQSEETISTFDGPDASVKSVSWNRDGNMIASADYRGMKIWDATTRKVIRTLFGYKGSLSWNGDGTKIAYGASYHTIQVWDVNTGELTFTFKGHSAEVTSLSWNYNGNTIASGSRDHKVKVWDANTGELIRTFEGHSDDVFSVSWNHDGSKIASGSKDTTIKIWDAATGPAIKTLEGHRNQVSSVSWNHNGTQIASASYDKTIRIWNGATGMVIITLEGRSDHIKSLAWKNDGTKIASGSDDKKIKIWDVTTCRIIITLDGHNDDVNSLSWSSDGTKIASGSADTTIKIWEEITDLI